MRVLGVDGCKAGWVAVALEDGRVADARVVPVFDELVDDEACVIGIDIPLGETVPGHRAADVVARRYLGPGHGPKVFTPPPLAAGDAETFADACAIAVECSGKQISMQAWRLLPKMLEVTPVWRADPERVREVHPECSFRTLREHTHRHGKKTWRGLWDRVAALREHGIEIPPDLDTVASIAPDDVLDAAAVAWTAQRIAQGVAVSLPDPPERDTEGRPVAIWC